MRMRRAWKRKDRRLVAFRRSFGKVKAPVVASDIIWASYGLIQQRMNEGVNRQETNKRGWRKRDKHAMRFPTPTIHFPLYTDTI